MIESRRLRLTLLALLLLAGAFGLRAWCGSVGLSAKLHWDEGYALDNVRSLLETGSFRPARSYYPSPVFNLPATLLVSAAEKAHERTGNPRWDAYDNGRFGAATYLVSRWLMALYGALAVLLLWRIGSLLIGEAGGLVAAALLLFLPWHIHASAIFKPDALLTASVLLAVWAALRATGGATERTRRGWAAVAGLGIALAASAKLTGVLVAAPVAVGLLAVAPRDRRRWEQVLIAGVTSAVAFAAMNPYWTSYLHYVASLKEDYAMRARWHGWTRGDAAWLSIRLFFEHYVHGPLLGGLAVIGALGGGRLALRSRDNVERARWAMVLLFPLLYATALVSQTAYFKPNNLLPVMPFTCLLIAWTLMHAWRWTMSQVSSRALRSGVAAAGLFALLVFGAWPGFRYVYDYVTPSTWDVAKWFLGKPMREGGRLVYVESQPSQTTRWFNSAPFATTLVGVDHLAGLDPRTLDQSDGEIFASERLAGSEASFYQARLDRIRDEATRLVQPRWFELRGPSLMVIRHPRRLVARGRMELTSCGDRCFGGELPARESGDEQLFTLRLTVPKRPVRLLPNPPTVTVDGQTVAVGPVSTSTKKQDYGTVPLALPAAPARVEVRLPEGDYLLPTARRRVRAEWASWRVAKKRLRPIRQRRQP